MDEEGDQAAEVNPYASSSSQNATPKGPISPTEAWFRDRVALLLAGLLGFCVMVACILGLAFLYAIVQSWWSG